MGARHNRLIIMMISLVNALMTEENCLEMRVLLATGTTDHLMKRDLPVARGTYDWWSATTVCTG